MQCDYFDAGLCRSCTLMGEPYPQQLAAKQRTVEGLLAPFGASITWSPPVMSAESGFRAKAKMVVGGSVDAPTLGILDGQGQGVDLRRCGVISPGILAAFPALIAFITTAALEPYDVPARRGELKHLIVTEASSGDLIVRFVVRSDHGLARVRTHLGELRASLPQARVVSVNLLPEHKAVLEGEIEHVLTEQRALAMPVGDVTLHALPRSFVQTNTAVAGELYRQAAAWINELSPAAVWDLYCGIGGFALHAAAPGRRVIGVEVSADAVTSAEMARDSVLSPAAGDVRFVAADATAWAAAQDALPELVIVNPPRRGLGAPLAEMLEHRGPRTIVYSSCNPESLARDLAAMPSYRVTRARVVDMFPQSRHTEVLTLLERRR